VVLTSIHIKKDMGREQVKGTKGEGTSWWGNQQQRKKGGSPYASVWRDQWVLGGGSEESLGRVVKANGLLKRALRPRDKCRDGFCELRNCGNSRIGRLSRRRTYVEGNVRVFGGNRRRMGYKRA